MEDSREVKLLGHILQALYVAVALPIARLRVPGVTNKTFAHIPELVFAIAF